MRLVRSERYSAGTALGLTLGRIPGVWVPSGWCVPCQL